MMKSVGTMKKLSPEALDVLGSGLTLSGLNAVIACQIDRKLYTEVNAALEAIGGKWNRKAKAHLFEEDPEEALDQVLCDGGFHDVKRDLNQFYTPPELAREIVARADVRGHTVLEPSAGRGAIVRECLAQGAAHVVSIDFDEKNCTALASIKDDRHALSTATDFLNTNDSPAFTRVVMNPPFSLQRDIDHVLKAFSHLLPGGRLVAIMSAGVEFRMDRKTKAFRDLVSDHGTMERLPEGSFKSSGTDVRTVVVTMVES